MSTEALRNETMPLLHMVAVCNDVSAIQHLLNSGWDIDHRNSRGQTALALALERGSFRGASHLLTHGAGVWDLDANGRSALQFCFQAKKRAPVQVVTMLMEQLQQCQHLSAEQKADELTTAGYPADRLFLVDDPEVLGLLLERRSLNPRESASLVQRALQFGRSQAALRALLTRGPGAAERRYALVDHVRKSPSDPLALACLARLADWRALDRDLMSHVAWCFGVDGETEVRAFLDAGLDVHARREFGGLEILARLFANVSVSDEAVDKWTRERRGFNVNGLDPFGRGALHWAASSCYKRRGRRVAHLLANGADPNLRGRCGQTPLFLAADDETRKLLLNAGADVQALDDCGRSAIGGDGLYSELVAVHVGILQARGLTLRPQMCVDMIRGQASEAYAAKIRLRCHRDLEWMKTRRIFTSSISLLDVLLDDPSRSARYVRDEGDVEAILQASRERVILMDDLAEILADKTRKALEVHRLKPVAAAFFCGVLNIYDASHLAIERIVEYLTYRELTMLQKVQCGKDNRN